MTMAGQLNQLFPLSQDLEVVAMPFYRDPVGKVGLSETTAL